MNKRRHSVSRRAAVCGLQGQEIGTWRHTGGALRPAGTREGGEIQREGVSHQHASFFTRCKLCFINMTMITCVYVN